MEALISSLVKRFETGMLTRRELVYGLTMLAAAGAETSATPLQGGSLKSTRIDHISIQVNDMPRSLAFYQNIFGLRVVSEDKPNEIVRLGTTKALVSLHHKSPTGLVDHFAIGIEQFSREAVTENLKQRGMSPEENLDAGFHVKDPDGISVQIVGD